MAFQKGAQAIRDDRACEACRNGRHGRCAFVRAFEEMNAGAVDAQDFVPLNPANYCGCYTESSGPHWREREREDEYEYEDEGSPVADEGTMESWRTWEVIFRPFPAVWKEGGGFDAVISKVADVIHDPEHWISKTWGDVGLAGRFEAEIEFSVDEPPEAGYAYSMTGDDFLMDVAKLVAELRLEGSMHLLTVCTVMDGAKLKAMGEED